MSDPRLNGDHLGLTRHEQYDAAVDDLLDARGPDTADADPLARLPAADPMASPSAVPSVPVRPEAPPPGGTYTLLSLGDGRRYPLRVGINALGRFTENDLVLHRHAISRRHCVVLVHATGGCEVHDTASRNGTFVNGRRVTQRILLPGDVLQLCDLRFLVAWVGPGEELLPAVEAHETLVGELPPMGDTLA
jgi:hypothetical protein